MISDAHPGERIISPFKAGEIDKFALKEGTTQVETLFFKVLKDPVVNLRRQMTTYKMGMQVDQRQEPMGTFEGPDQEHCFTFPSSPVPSGWHVRGQYRLVVEFIDNNGPCFPPIEKQFSIVKK